MGSWSRGSLAEFQGGCHARSHPQAERTAIVIGKDIKITVVQIKGDQVRLGFEAPRDIEIMRSELIEVELGETPKVDEDTSKFKKALVQAG